MSNTAVAMIAQATKAADPVQAMSCVIGERITKRVLSSDRKKSRCSGKLCSSFRLILWVSFVSKTPPYPLPQTYRAAVPLGALSQGLPFWSFELQVLLTFLAGTKGRSGQEFADEFRSLKVFRR